MSALRRTRCITMRQGHKLASYGPDLDFLRYDAPVGVVVIRRDDVQIVHIVLDEAVQLTLSEDVVIPVARHQPSHLIPGKTFLRRGLREGRGATQFCPAAGQHLLD